MALGPRRIYEIDLMIPTLRLLAQAPNFQMKTGDLRRELELIFNPQGADAVVVNGQTRFSQIARNMVSNRHRGRNVVNRKYADYVPNPAKANDGALALRESGLDLLEAIGYRVTGKLRTKVREAEAARPSDTPATRRSRKS